MSPPSGPPPRRIVPERIAPSQAVASANPVFLSAPTQQVQRAIDLREQAAIAKEKLPPGRRIYVDLSVSRDVSWRQLMKAQGVSTTPARAAQPDADAPPQELGRREQRNVFASVIARLEKAYVAHDDDEESDSDSEPRQEGPLLAEASDDDAEGPGDAAGPDGGQEAGAAAALAAAPSGTVPAPAKEGKEKDKADEAQRNDHYDYEDDFIDDSEFVEYYEGGDRRKAKYSGFFINKGAVEKTGEAPVILPTPPKRKRKRPARPGDEDDDGAAYGALKKRKAVGDGTKPRKVMRVTDGLVVNGAADAEGKTPGSARKAKPAGGSGYDMSPELRKVLEAMRAAVAPLPHPPADDKKQGLPQVVKDLLPGLSRHLTRDMRRHRNSRFGEQQVRSAVLTEAMAFLEPWILRNNFNSAIKRHQDKQAREYKEARQALLEAIHSRLPPGVVLPRAPDTASAGGVLEAALQDVSQVSAPGDESPTGQPPLYAPTVAAGPFAWDSEVEERFARFVTVRISYLGGSTLGERGEKLFEELCRLWPLGSVSADSLRKVHTNRKRAQTKAVNQARKEQEAAGGFTGQQDASQPAAAVSGAGTPVGPGTSQLSTALMQQLAAGGGAAVTAPLGPVFQAPASQPQQQHILPPPGSMANSMQQEYSNGGEAAALMQASAPATSLYPATLPQPTTFSVPMPHSAPHVIASQTGLQPTAQYSVPMAQNVAFALQPGVLSLQPAPGQSIADATMAAIQAQQAQMRQQQQYQQQQQHQLAQLLPQTQQNGLHNSVRGHALQAQQRPASLPVVSAPAQNQQHPQTVSPPQQHAGQLDPVNSRPAVGVSTAALTGQPSDASQPPALAFGPLVPIDPEEHIAVGVAKGAPRAALEVSVAELGASTAKGLVNLILMHAGTEGLMVRDVIRKATELRMADWADNKGKKSHVGSIINKEKDFVHIGGWKYTLRCFPGVKEVPTREGGSGGGKAKTAVGASIQDFFASSQINQPNTAAPD